MALVKYGAGIVQMSGSIAGDVHARNRFGNYIRPRTKPVNPHSERQEAARTVLSFLAEYWHTELDDDQRGLWNTYAAAVGMTNRLGETIHLTGFNHFIRTNTAAMDAKFGILPDAPAIGSLPEKDTILGCTEENINDQTLTMRCDSAGWADTGDTKRFVHVYMGRPQLQSRFYFQGPWRYMDSFTAVTGPVGHKDMPAPFAFAVDQKVWFQGRLQTISGRTSQIWSLPSRTIVKDPDG